MVQTTRVLLLFATISVWSSAANSNELSDSITAFHRGDYPSALSGFGELASAGSKDARVYYYRGLIYLRQRNPGAAAQDFEAAMHLEAAGQGQQVGESLQRVQGHERLVIEKYRAMARLASRNRTQPVAPTARVYPFVTQTTAAVVSAQAPVFRLASEIPMRTPVALLQPTQSLVTDETPQQPVAVPTAEMPAADDEPVGTGVLDEDDPFAEFAAPDRGAVADFGSDELAEPSRVQSAVGGIFRALFRANVPQIGLPQGIPGVGGGDFGGPPPGDFGGPGFDEAGFDDSGFDNSEPGFGDESMDDEDDFFGDF